MAAEIEGAQTVRLSSEHDDYAWVPLAAARELDLCPAFRGLVERLADEEETA
jgi:hypothetical protein